MSDPATSAPPHLVWQVAPAYDLFISLEVIYHPEKYNLRGAWAAGVRSRLSEEARTFLEKAVEMGIPLDWLQQLPAPQSGEVLLEALAAHSPAARLEQIYLKSPSFPDDVRAILERVLAQGGWDPQDLQHLRQAAKKERPGRKKQQLVNVLNLWSESERSGEKLLAALREYYEVFFAEEEQRILPYLEQAVAQGREAAATMSFAALVEELSQGIRYEKWPSLDKVVIAPSFWSTPLIVDHQVGPGALLFIFGARPPHVSLVPGEPVPDDLQQALKALADPTRLRILHLLAEEAQSPSALARQLRLRAPTVVHHLHTLRLARLVYLTMGDQGKKRYALREGGVDQVWDTLKQFLRGPGQE